MQKLQIELNLRKLFFPHGCFCLFVSFICFSLLLPKAASCLCSCDSLASTCTLCSLSKSLYRGEKPLTGELASDLSSGPDGKRRVCVCTDGSLCYVLVPFCTPAESVLSPLLRSSFCGRNKPVGSVSLFSQWLKTCGFCLLLTQQGALSCKIVQGISARCDFLGQLYEVLAALYLVKGQSAKPQQQFCRPKATPQSR